MLKVPDMDGHPALQAWHGSDGELLIGGLPLTRLAQRVGQTPFYAYDRARIETRVKELRDHLPAGVGLHYAVKANRMPALVCFLAPWVDGFDVASAGELTTALDTGMPPEKIGFAGPGKADRELAQAVAAGVLIEVESAGEMARLDAIASGMGAPPRIALRINPDFQLKGSGMRMGGGPQQFGIDAEDAPRLIDKGQTRGLALRYLNLGGGFGIPYFPKDKPFDLARVCENLAGVVASLAQAQPEARPVLELGRYIVGEAGVYVTRIIDRKVSRGEVFLVTDGGLHHNLAASGNFGQVIRRNFPVLIANKMAEASTEQASVVGCLCTPLDLLADKVSLSRSEVGDLVAVFQAGAYGLTASPSAFLGHPAPVEVLV
jgi:diaminopimelate decarboxylase